MHCAASNTAFQSSSLCEPTTRHERDFVHTEVVAGGLMHVADRAGKELYQNSAAPAHPPQPPLATFGSLGVEGQYIH
jgi:hypothetical protein